MKTLALIAFFISVPVLGLVGGRKAAHNDFPSVVLLEDCTATKVGELHFLLAAHCVVDAATHSGEASYQNQVQQKYGQGSVISLDRNVSHKKGGWTHSLTILKTFVHPAYRYSSVHHVWLKPQAISDVAIVVVTEKTPEIPVSPILSTPPEVGETVIKLGYGCPEILDPKIKEWVLGGDRELHFSKSGIIAGPDALESLYKTVTKSSKELAFYSSNNQRQFLAGSFHLTQGRFHAGPPSSESDEGDKAQVSLGFSDSGGPLMVIRDGKTAVAGVNAKSLLWPANEHETKLIPVALDLHTRLDKKSFSGTYDWLQGILGISGKSLQGGSALDGLFAEVLNPLVLPTKDEVFAFRKYLLADRKKMLLTLSTATGEDCPVQILSISLYDLNLEELVVWTVKPDKNGEEKKLKPLGHGQWQLVSKEEVRAESLQLVAEVAKKATAPVCLMRLE